MKSYNSHLHYFSALASVLEKLPSIGKKSAKKMAYTLSVEDAYLGLQLSESIKAAITNTHRCKICHALAHSEICHICLDSTRKNGSLCVVGNPRDIFLIEEIGEFHGVYCVLDDLKEFDFLSLRDRIEKEDIKEVIFAFSPSLQSDMLMLHIEDKLDGLCLNFSKIAQGVPQNISLDNIDSISLAKAFTSRIKT